MPWFANFVSLDRRQFTVGEAVPREAAELTPESIPSRREQFMLGRQAAHQALAGLGRDGEPILVGTNREPIWPEGIVGAIAHTDGHAVALVAPSEHTDGVGVDVERRREVPELFDTVLHPEEWAWFERIAPDRRDDAVLGVFSAKECIYKAFFHRVGSYFGFDAAVLEPTEYGFEGRLVSHIDADYPPERAFAVHLVWQGNVVVSWLVLPKTRNVA